MTRVALALIVAVVTIAPSIASADDNAAAAPAITLSLREGSTMVFGGRETTLHVDVQSPDAIAGNLVWRQTADSRTLAAGEMPAKVGDPAVLPLRVPVVNEGVALETQLTVTLVDPAAGAGKQPLATLTRRLWIVDANAFALRQQWLASLHLALYDPVGDTARVFEQAKIPFQPLASLGAVEQVSSGIVVIGEQIDFERAGTLAETMFRTAAKGTAVLCLAPAAGELPNPAAVAGSSLALRFEGDRIVGLLDKRLSSAAWPAEGQQGIRRFVPELSRGVCYLRVANHGVGWSWIEAGDSQHSKLILCGFPLIATWQREPTGRYLLAWILTELDPAQEVAAP